MGVILKRLVFEPHPKPTLPWMVRVEDSEPCQAEVFVDSTGEVMTWQVVVRDLPIEQCRALNLLSWQGPLFVTVELVAFSDLSFWGKSLFTGYQCSLGDVDTIVELIGYGGLYKTRAEIG